MNILFLHPNFPAQFKHIATYLARDNNNDVKFICETHYGRRIKGVELIVSTKKDGKESKTNGPVNENIENFNRAKRYRKCFAALENTKKWTPDIIISHCGWGCGLHAKEIWPLSYNISYIEWWFSPQSELTQALQNNPNLKFGEKTMMNLWQRNLPMSFELINADKIISPTEWQKAQFPMQIQKACDVIYDGIDRDIYKPDKNLRSKVPLITYGTRGMEPIRGFPNFIKTLPLIIRRMPNIRIQIAGIDEVCYGGKKPKSGTWGQWAKSYLDKHGVAKNIEWLGRLSPDKYTNWLKSSWCHVYLTEPYVLSWSFLEAACSGAPIVVNQSGAIEEFADESDLSGIFKCSSLDHNELASTIEGVLKNERRWDYAALSSAGIGAKVDLERTMEQWRRITDVDPTTQR